MGRGETEARHFLEGDSYNRASYEIKAVINEAKTQLEQEVDLEKRDLYALGIPTKSFEERLQDQSQPRPSYPDSDVMLSSQDARLVDDANTQLNEDIMVIIKNRLHRAAESDQDEIKLGPYDHLQ